MPLFQYIGEGHTLIQTKKYAREKVKVSYGEIVEIEEGVHAASRIIMAGFQLVEEGAEVSWNNNTAIGISALYSNTKGSNSSAIGTNTKLSNDGGEVYADGDGKIADGEKSEGPAPETPSVDITTEVVDDGSKDITLEVTTDETNVVTTGEEKPAAEVIAEATTTTASTEEAPKKAAPQAKKK